ncbi:MAG: efflux RND transporter permease subunit [Thermoleophilaceae bacterium]
MLSGETFGRVARAAVRRSGLVLAVFGILAAAGVAGSLTLRASASPDTLVDRGSESFEATEGFKREFGDEAVVVLVRGNLQRTVLTADLGRLLALEGCLSGNVPPEGLRSLPPQCTALARARPVKAVYGPATFVNTAVGQIREGLDGRRAQTAVDAERAAAAARRVADRRGASPAAQRAAGESAARAVQERFQTEVVQFAARYGITSLPSIDNPSFVSALVFDTARGVGIPKSRFAYLFPSPRAAVVQVRLRPELSPQARSEAISLIRETTEQPRFALQQGGGYVVTGVPVIVEDLGEEIRRAVLVLLLAGVLIMTLTLALVFRSSLRLLPLLMALGAAALAFGALALAGGSLTMASIAALPVLIGLAVDYAIQFQARYDESREVVAPGRGDSGGVTVEEGERVAVRAASLGGPIIATAALASALGFLVLVLSPVPMVRGFGLIVVLGVAIALACALTAGFAALVRLGSRHERAPDVPPIMPRTRVVLARASRMGPLARARRGGGWLRAGASRGLSVAVSRPGRVLAVGLVLAVLGWVADTQTTVISDVRQLVPADMPALRDVNALQEATGVAGEVDVTVRADDLTRPEVVRWMVAYQRDVLAAHGYRPGASCAQPRAGPELCPGLALTDLLRGNDPANPGATRALLDAVPRYFSQAVVSDDRSTANLAFGIRLMPLDRQQEVIEDMRDRLRPPPGVSAAVGGAPVLVAEGNEALASPWRRFLTLLAGLAAVFLVLFAVRRRHDEALLPLIPIALATGWSSLILFVLRIPLNPLSAALGALVIAISTEFSVLLSARYREERDAGFEGPEALRRTYESTGAAVLASGVTAVAGFAALIFSDIRMLRDFGIVTVVDLTVSLIGVGLALPAALVWGEGRGAFTWRSLDPRRVLGRRRMRAEATAYSGPAPPDGRRGAAERPPTRA